MSKYKALDEPITRREACLIIDRKRFNGMVRSGELKPLGKRGDEGTAVEMPDAKRTAPLMFDQQAVRDAARSVSDALAIDARGYRESARAVRTQPDPLTRRQVASLIGKRLTGVLIRSGMLVPSGTLTDTKTAAHTFAADHVREVFLALADEAAAESKLLGRSSRVRVPA